MKIKQIKIENFKFHHKLEFEIKRKNCLIYGENGTGKSSIYEALYSNFYYYKNQKIYNSVIKIRDEFLHRNFISEDLKVDILFDNSKRLNRINDSITSDVLSKPNDSSKIVEENVYFINEKVLRNINGENLFNIIENDLKIHFPKLGEIISCYTEVKKYLHNLKKREKRIDEGENILRKRKDADEACKNAFNELIPLDSINCILKNNLSCDFEIDYSFEDSNIEHDNYIFNNPIIKFKIKGIDDKNNFINHLNEAKLKQISIAVFFALIKIYKVEKGLKLLVLDDFLTSLDMANRKKIAYFIIEDFKEYQIIILTHNIHFYNLLKKLTNDNEWDDKILFTMKENNYIATQIKDKDDNYIQEAKKIINSEGHKLGTAGNLLRKAFESIIHECEQLLEVGRVENLKNVLSALNDDKVYFYKKPHTTLNNLIYDCENIFNKENQSNEEKISILRNKIDSLKNNEITFLNKSRTYNKSYNILKEIEFYKDLFMNESSHHSPEMELYQKECEEAIALLEDLYDLLYRLKK